jgi:hypothetical protein
VQQGFKLQIPGTFLPIALGIGLVGAVGIEIVGRWSARRSGHSVAGHPA